MNKNTAPIGTHFPARVSVPAIPAPFARDIARSSFNEIFDELFNEFFGRKQSVKDKLISKGKFPKTDIIVSTRKDNSKSLVFVLAVPGVNSEDIHIDANFEEGTLTVSYDRESVLEQRSLDKETNEDLGIKNNYIQKELSNGSFFRSWTIPKEVIKFEKEDDVHVSLSDGILRLEVCFIPKEEEKKEPEKPKTKRLAIKKMTLVSPDRLKEWVNSPLEKKSH